MNRLIAISVVCALTVHALLGCCGHHAHGQSPNENARQMVDSEAAHCCSHLKHEAEHEHSPPDKPEPDCEEGSCVFVRSDAGQATTVDIGAILSFMAECPSLRLQQTRFLNSFAQYGAIEEFGPSWRLHLRHQILLI